VSRIFSAQANGSFRNNTAKAAFRDPLPLRHSQCQISKKKQEQKNNTHLLRNLDR
jgi:hypothetical protein